MPRLRSQIYEMDGRAKLDLLMALRMGPTIGDGLTGEDLRVGWEVYGEKIMGEGRRTLIAWPRKRVERGER